VASPVLKAFELKGEDGEQIVTLTDREHSPHSAVASKGAFSVKDKDGHPLSAPRADAILRHAIETSVMVPVGHALVEGAHDAQNMDADGFNAYQNDGDFIAGPYAWSRARDRDLAARTTWRRPLVGNIFAPKAQPAVIQSNEPPAGVAVIVKGALNMLRKQRMYPVVLRYLDNGGDTGPPPVRGIAHPC
jgi:hypothetical protein